MKTRRFLLAIMCLMMFRVTQVFTFGADEGTNPTAAAMKKQLNEMLYKRVKTAQLCFDATQAAYQAETVTASQLITAMNNLVEAKLAVARTPQEEIAALEEHVKNAQNVEQTLKLLFDAGSRGGKTETYALATFTRESSEISLLRARLKTKQ